MSVFKNPQFFIDLYPKPIVGVLMATPRHLQMLIDGKVFTVSMAITNVQTDQGPNYLRLTTRGYDENQTILFKYYIYLGFWREGFGEFHLKVLEGNQPEKLTLHNGATEEQAEYILTMARLCGERVI